ncbi:dihydrofolate reductase, partial [Mycobacterium avium subsp. hominissuis]
WLASRSGLRYRFHSYRRDPRASVRGCSPSRPS